MAHAQQSVLIVDESSETREVLQTVLERRGVHTLSAARTEIGLQLAQQHHPDLIVLDLDTFDAPEQLVGRVADLSHQARYQPRMVLLGSLRGWHGRRPEGEFVSKPYHYGPLIRRIEELLGHYQETPGRADVVRDSRDRSGQPL